MLAKYEVSISYSSKVLAKVKVDNRLDVLKLLHKSNLHTASLKREHWLPRLKVKVTIDTSGDYKLDIHCKPIKCSTLLIHDP